VTHRYIFAALMLSCGVLWLGLSRHLPGMVGIAVISGWIAVVAAIVAFAVTVILLLIRALTGQARPLLRRSGLALVNFLGALIAVWLLFQPLGYS
jgi:hypothetical protein